MKGAAQREPMAAVFSDRWVLYLTASERALLVKCITLYARTAGDVKFYSQTDQSEAHADTLLDKVLQAPKLERGKQVQHE